MTSTIRARAARFNRGGRRRETPSASTEVLQTTATFGTALGPPRDWTRFLVPRRPPRPFADRLRDFVAENAPASACPVRGLWDLGCVYQPNPTERKFDYRILVAKTTGQGACYYVGDPLDDAALAARVGEPFDIAAAQPGDTVDFALLDSVAAGAGAEPDIAVELHGSSTTKAVERARVIVGEVDHLLGDRAGRRNVVCNVGTVSLVVSELARRGYRVTSTDMERDLIGREVVPGTVVDSGEDTLANVEEADVAVVTGMTVANETFSDIVEAARAGRTSLVMFCETGSGLASFLLDEGVDSVVAEPFPFYIFDGTTRLRVHRRRRR